MKCNWEERGCGYRRTIDTQMGEVELFFGFSGSTVEALQSEQPHLQFLTLKQVHGCRIIEHGQAVDPASAPPQADAHVTDRPSRALCVRTADCMPLLAVDVRTGRIGAAHSGWRGHAQGLPHLFVDHFLRSGSRRQDLHIYIGPHIARTSFQIGPDALDPLMEEVERSGGICDRRQIYDQESRTFDLLELTRIQLAPRELGRIEVLKIDTKTDARFESFRRNKGSALRQHSYVVRHSTTSN